MGENEESCIPVLPAGVDVAAYNRSMGTLAEMNERAIALQKEQPTLRDRFAMAAPIGLDDAARALGKISLSDMCHAEDRANLIAFLAKLRYEYADAALKARG